MRISTERRYVILTHSDIKEMVVSCYMSKIFDY